MNIFRQAKSRILGLKFTCLVIFFTLEINFFFVPKTLKRLKMLPYVLNHNDKKSLRVPRVPDYKYCCKKCKLISLYTVCPRSVDPLYIVTYYIEWVKTSCRILTVSAIY